MKLGFHYPTDLKIPEMATDHSMRAAPSVPVPSHLTSTTFPVARRHAFDDELIEVASRLGVLSLLDDVYDMTASIFPAAIEVRVDEDPEVENDPRILFVVQASGTAEEIVDSHRHWIRRLRAFQQPATFWFSLSVVALK